MSKSLLIVGCSMIKKNYEEPIPALHVYDGPLQRFLRRKLEGQDSPIDVFLLSAEYGLIGGWDMIEWYEQEMTYERVEALRGQVGERIRELLASGIYSECFVSLSRRYMDVARRGFVDSPMPVTLADSRRDREEQVRMWVELRL